VHHLGINASRSWGFYALYAATRNEKWEKIYFAHVKASIDLHDKMK